MPDGLVVAPVAEVVPSTVPAEIGIFPSPTMADRAQIYYTRKGVKISIDMDSSQLVGVVDSQLRGAVWHYPDLIATEVDRTAFQALLDRFGFVQTCGRPCFVETVHGVQMARDLTHIGNPYVAAREDSASAWIGWDQPGYERLRLHHVHSCAV